MLKRYPTSLEIHRRMQMMVFWLSAASLLVIGLVIGLLGYGYYKFIL